MSRRAWASVCLPLVLAVAGCSGDTPAEPEAAASSDTSSPTPSASTTAAAVDVPDDRACFALVFDDALAPTNASPAIDCADEHTSMTYAVGELDTVVAGHLVSVDSRQVQRQVSTECPRKLTTFLGGSPDALRLSMLRAVWFTPTVEESESGANWYRCDVIAVAADGELTPLTGRLAGVLDKPLAARGYGMCGTAEPGSDGFSRVICSSRHSWRAIETVDVGGERYPGEEAAREAGQGPCEDAARERANDALNFTWGYEWPTAQQWKAGQTYGLCWVPD